MSSSSSLSASLGASPWAESLAHGPADSRHRQLFGYDVIEFLGEGAGSTIHVVSSPDTRQLYALKHVVVKDDKQLRFAEQLINEYEVARGIKHPLVRGVVDMKVNKSFFRKITEAALVMELVDGSPLDARPMGTVARTVALFGQVAKALGVLHAEGFVHCDLKPNNILVREDGSIKLIDFGQACRMMTIKRRIQGTPDFISPEQVKCEPVTARTDVFNFGATMYWALCNKSLPTLFHVRKNGANSFLLDRAIQTPRDVNPKVPEQLSNLVMECARTNPAKRPSDMNEIAGRLEIMGVAVGKTSL